MHTIIKRTLAAASALMLTAGSLLPIATVSAAGTNLIANPGFETASGTKPANWSSDKWGTNTASFLYNTTGHSGSRSGTVTVSGYKTGDAKWYFTPVTVTPGHTYTFSDWYKSGVKTHLHAVITTTSGGTNYDWMADIAASTAWKQQTIKFTAPANAKSVTFYHYLTSNGSLSVDDYSLTDDSATTPTPTPTPTPVNVAPSVSLTAPAAGATVSGTANVTANATDDKAVASVQFKLDGNNLGAAITAAPYSFAWDTTTASNGSHSLTAVATDNEGLSTTSTAATVNVNNVVVTPPPVTPPASNNLIANPSVETATNNLPNGWTGDGWGTNTHAFSYEATGQDGSHSLKTTVSAYTNGDAKWYFNPVAVTPGVAYNYSEYYKSDITSEVDAMVTLNDGTVAYYWLGAPAAASNWTKAAYQFTAPANAKNVTIFHVVAAQGYVQNDNFSLAAYTPAQFNRALVSLTFDDGWRNIYTNGYPLLQKYGLVSTQYLNSEPVMGGYPDYMTYAMIKDFKNQGSELAWHTRTHADVTTLTASQLNTELTIPAAFLTGTGTVASDWKNFATPYGAYNATAVNAIMQKYQSHRSTDVGYNSKDNFDITNIKVQNITNTTTPADVQAWVNQAAANKTWLVIVYHEVTATAEDPTYAVTPANLDSELNIVKQSGVTVKTVDQAIAEIKSQL